MLGQAIGFAVPGASRVALALVACAMVVTVIGLAWRLPRPGDAAPRRALALVWLTALAAGLLRLPGKTIHAGYPAGDGTFFLFVAIATVLALGAMFLKSRVAASTCFWLLLVVHLFTGVWFLTLGNVKAVTDVHLVQELATAALLRGENPFAITFPDLYGPAAPIYPRGIVVDGQVQCGYFYPPLSLLLDLPAPLLGEVRHVHLIAIELSAALIAFAAPRGRGRRAFGPAVVLLFLPTVFYQVRGAWIEPFVLLFLCATVFLWMRNRTTLTMVALGLFLVTKQFVPFTLPAAWLLIPREAPTRQKLKWFAIAVAAGAAVTLPFVLWDVRAFLHSQTALFVGMLRQDSISFAPMIARATGWRPTLLWPALAAVPAAALVLWRAPRDASGFAAGAALILLCVFAFSTQAFGNYYFLAAGALCMAAAVATPPDRVSSPA